VKKRRNHRTQVLRERRCQKGLADEFENAKVRKTAFLQACRKNIAGVAGEGELKVRPKCWFPWKRPMKVPVDAEDQP